MRVLTVNTNNSAGGATKACVRLHQSLLEAGVASDLLMLEKPAGNVPRGHDFYAFHQQQRQQQYARQSLPRKLIGKVAHRLQLNEDSYYERLGVFQRKLLAQKRESLEVFTFSQSPYRIQEHPLYHQADIIHFHWVSNSFLDYEHFFPANQKPVVWTLHDTNPFTGGCHYTEGCRAFESDCAGCPQLAGSDAPDYAAESLARKVTALQHKTNRYDCFPFPVAAGRVQKEPPVPEPAPPAHSQRNRFTHLSTPRPALFPAAFGNSVRQARHSFRGVLGGQQTQRLSSAAGSGGTVEPA
jgi:hypothetical protein